MPPILCLLDGHALAYRAYFALNTSSGPSFTTRSGELTTGVYGFASVLLRILEQERPDYIAVAFDTGRTFRDHIYPAYKGTRAKMPADLSAQVNRVRQLVDTFSIPRLEVEGYEADDVLGSVARQAAERGIGVKIITGDRDLLQLVDHRILVNLPGRTLSEARDYGPDDVEAYLGVRPEQVVDYKALVGDKSDNIPGVAGIGEKTTVNLLKTYGTLDAIYEHLDELPAGVRSKLEAGRENAYLSRELATIIKDLNIPFDLSTARVDQFDVRRVETLFRELEFRSLLHRLNEIADLYGKTAARKGQQLSLFGDRVEVLGEPEKSPSADVRAHVVDTPEALQELVAQLEAAERISFDTETTSTDQMQADLVGISLAVNGEEGYYIPVGHRPELGRQLPLETVIEGLRGPLTNPNIPKVGHNLKYDYVLLARYGLRPTPLGFDTMMAEWLANPASHNLGLKNLAWVRLDIQMTEIVQLIGKGKKQCTMAEVEIERCAAYAAADAAVVLRLIPLLEDELEECHATSLLQNLEMPLIPVLADMEMAGVALDTAFLEEMSKELTSRMRSLEEQVFQTVGEPFNLNSTQQLSIALFERLGLSAPLGTKRNVSGHYSTSADVLDSLRGAHPVVDWVLEYRELAKLKSTYVDALPVQINPRTQRVHTSYNQAGSVTGRIASYDPNLQNIPIRSDLGRQVRNAFVASPGRLLLSVDYSQVELRIAASMSDDQAMLAAFQAGHDIHAATAAAIYGVPIERVSKEQRRRAKGINFGLIYGISAFGLTRYTDLTLAESEDFMVAYFQQFPGIKHFLDSIRLQAAQRGYVETLLGRRRYFPGLKDQRNPAMRNREEREAINAPIQGTAADIMKIAMIRVPAAVAEAGLSGKMLLQVHDELVLEVPEEELMKTAAVVQKAMEEAFELKAPLKTDARSGLNWGELSPLSE